MKIYNYFRHITDTILKIAETLENMTGEKPGGPRVGLSSFAWTAGGLEVTLEGGPLRTVLLTEWEDAAGDLCAEIDAIPYEEDPGPHLLAHFEKVRKRLDG